MMISEFLYVFVIHGSVSSAKTQWWHKTNKIRTRCSGKWTSQQVFWTTQKNAAFGCFTSLFFIQNNHLIPLISVRKGKLWRRQPTHKKKEHDSISLCLTFCLFSAFSTVCTTNWQYFNIYFFSSCCTRNSLLSRTWLQVCPVSVSLYFLKLIIRPFSDFQITAAWTATSYPLESSSWWPLPASLELATPGLATS